MAPVIISIEGNIGAGKSTLINYLKKNLHSVEYVPVVYVDEPVEEWSTIRSVDNKTMIELFYSDPKRYAFSFQMMAYISRLANLSTVVENNPNAIIITERSLLTDYHIFAKMLHESNEITQEEYTIYCKWFHYFNHFDISGIIYVKCPVTVAHERCVQRNRTGETIDMNYLQKLQDKHEEWIHSETDIGVFTVHSENDINEIMYSIEDFISEFVDPVEDDILGNQLHWAVNCYQKYKELILIGSFVMWMYRLQKA
jgi:deoxyadenosine/deoxycytidine kinase